jgi:hypothetical protein
MIINIVINFTLLSFHQMFFPQGGRKNGKGRI